MLLMPLLILEKGGGGLPLEGVGGSAFGGRSGLPLGEGVCMEGHLPTPTPPHCPAEVDLPAVVTHPTGMHYVEVVNAHHNDMLKITITTRSFEISWDCDINGTFVYKH